MANRFANRFKSDSPRLNNWNYSTPGNYFVTICTYNHNNFFGKICDDKMVLSPRGKIACDELLKTIIIRKNIIIDPWVIMPNHVHLLIRLRNLLVEMPTSVDNLNHSTLVVGQHLSCKSLNRNLLVETRCNASLQYNRKITLITHGHKNHPDFFQNINVKSNQIIPSTIRAFKQSVKRLCKQQHLYFSWQLRYYDEIIKDNPKLTVVKNYIINNPKNWQKDKFYN